MTRQTKRKTEDARTAVARAIWNIRREAEDRFDMELEDMGDDHPVWDEADAAIAAAIAAIAPASPHKESQNG